jgi:hypothetical protein
MEPARFEPTVDPPARKRKAKAAKKKKDKTMKRASRAANLPLAASSPMADRTNRSGSRGTFDALSPISQAAEDDISFSSVFGGISPARLEAKLVDPAKVHERGIELIGRHVLKQFGAAKEKFRGTVVSVDEEQTPPLYLVRYEDGDEEDVAEGVILKCLLSTHAAAAAAAAAGADTSTRSAASAASAANSSASSAGSYRSNASGSGSESEMMDGSRQMQKPHRKQQLQQQQKKQQQQQQQQQKPQRRRARKESKTMQLQREAATKSFIQNRKQYFSQLDTFELECE